MKIPLFFNNTARSANTEQTEERLRTHVFQLADTIGERNAYKAGTMERSAQYIDQALAGMGYAVTRTAPYAPERGIRTAWRVTA